MSYVQSNLWMSVNTSINLWTEGINSYDYLKKAFTNAHACYSQIEKARLIEISARERVLQQAISLEDSDFVKALVNAGLNVNDVDQEGNSLLAKVNCPELFLWLLQSGAQLVKKRHSTPLLIHVLCFCNLADQQKSAKWRNILPDVVAKCPLEDFWKLSHSKTLFLITQCKNNERLVESFKNIAKELPQANIEKINFNVIFDLIGDEEDVDCLAAFTWLIKENYLKNPLLEQIITFPSFMYYAISIPHVLKILKSYWQPSPEVNFFIQLCGDFRLGLLCKSLLNTTSLHQAAQILVAYTLSPEKIDSGTCKQIVSHVHQLQMQEKGSLWLEICKEHEITIDTIYVMVEMGFDPLWVDPIHHRTFLFSKRIGQLSFDEKIFRMGFDLHHADIDNCNALEHHCRNEVSVGCIIKLLDLGLTIRSHFPSIDKAKETFPDDPLLQAIYAAYLYNSQKNDFQTLYASIPKKKRDEVENALKNNPKIYVWPNFQSDEVKKNYYLEKALTSNIIEEKFPLASLAIYTIKNRVLDFLDLLTFLPPSEIVFFNRYIFEHPEVMQIIIRDFMKVEKVEIQVGGGTASTHSKLVSSMIMTNNQMKSSSSALSRKLQSAFHADVPFVEKNNLDIDEDFEKQKYKLQGRTLYFPKGEYVEAFKFLKMGEKYNYFAQEHSVSKALCETSEHFKSQFLNPIGIYAVKKLPTVLDKHTTELFTNTVPAYVFHYRATPGKFVYLQNVSQDKYPSSRAICLHDAAKLIHLGIYPDLSPLFHDQDSDRKYILLADLFSYACTGAGRLEHPFLTNMYPNLRESGLTDNRDALIIDEPKEQYLTPKDMNGNRKLPSFRQMDALSKALLVDMLILAQRYMNANELKWQNKDLMYKFGQDLAKGHALLTSAFCNETYERSYNFVVNSGINWELAAKQIAFWIDISPEGYPHWLSKKQIPDGLYESHTKIIVDASRADNFDPILGCQTKGHQDIGLDNGPLACTEFEKSAYLLFNAVLREI